MKVGCAVVSGRLVSKLRLPDMASIFTAVLTAMLLTLDFIEKSHNNKFAICVDCVRQLSNSMLIIPSSWNFEYVQLDCLDTNM